MPDSEYQQTEVDAQARRRGRRLLRRRDRRAEHPRGALRLARQPPPAEAARRVARRPEAVGRSILQDIREFSAGHSQADDITLICFGPTVDSVDRAVTTRVPTCPHVPEGRQLRLELDEPEAALAEKLSARLGVGPRRSPAGGSSARASTRAGTTTSTSSTRPRSSCPSDEAGSPARRLGPDVEPFVPEPFDWPEPGPRPLEHRPVIVGAGPAGLFAGYLLALDGYRPLSSNAAARSRTASPTSAGSTPAGRSTPRATTSSAKGARARSATASSPAAAPGPTSAASWRSSPSATASRRSSTSTARTSARTACPWSSAPSGASSKSSAARSASPAGSRTSTSPTAGSAGLLTSSGYVAADVAVLAIGHSARDTYAMLLRRGVPLEAKPFQLGVRIEQPQEQVNVARYGRFADHPALGAADYNLVARAGGRDLFTFCMCAGGYVMPSVSEPGYFCTNGMSVSRHDSPFANSGLVVTIEPGDTGSRHPLAGVHFQQRAERLAYLAGGRTTPRRSSGPATSWPAGRAGASCRAATPRGTVADRPGRDPAAGRARGPGARACRHGPPVPGPVPQGRDPDRPRVARQLAGPDSPRRRHRARARPSPGSTPAAKGPATPAGSSARPSTACAPPACSWRPTHGRRHETSSARSSVAAHPTRSRPWTASDPTGTRVPHAVRNAAARVGSEPARPQDFGLGRGGGVGLGLLGGGLGRARRSALAALASAGVALPAGNRSLSRTALPERSRR